MKVPPTRARQTACAASFLALTALVVYSVAPFRSAAAGGPAPGVVGRAALSYAASPGEGGRTLTLGLEGGELALTDKKHGLLGSRPLASTGEAVVKGSTGDDTLVVDFTRGNPIPAGGLTFEGGAQVTRTGDGIVMKGGSFRTAVYDYYSPNDGRIVLDGSVVNYVGLEPITNTGTADAIVFNLPDDGQDNQAILEDDGVPGNGMSRLRSGNGTFETTDFANPTGSLTINASDDGERITVNVLDSGYGSAPININGNSGDDTFALGDGATLKGGGINGAGGSNTLDYSAYTTPVSVNLGTAPLLPFLSATVNGIQQTPPNASAANGFATMNYSSTTHSFDVNMSVGGITPAQVTGLKIRRAAVNAAGPVVIDLTGVGSLNSDGSGGFQYLSGPLALAPEQQAALLGGLMYVEVQTTAFPAGEVRGQFISTSPFSSSLPSATGVGGIAVNNIRTVIGGSGNDSLVGSIVDDVLRGGPGDDTLLGGPGTGAPGTEILQGEGGNDTFSWNNGDGPDTIDGGAGDDLVNVNGVPSSNDTFVVSPATVSPAGPGRLEFRRVAPGTFSLDIGTTESLTANGYEGNDTFIAQSLAGVNDIAAVNFNGLFGNDSFTIAPAAAVTFNVNGGDPSPPTFPGDLLALDTAGVTNLALTANNTAIGSSGTYTFGNRQPVSFQTVEAVNPTTVKVGDVTAAEGNVGSSGAVFVVSLEAPTNTTVTVDYVTFNGTATAPGDFLSVNGTLTFSPGQTTRFVTVPVNGDTQPEGNETVVLNLSNPVGALMGDPQGVATIADDDASNIFQFGTGAASVSEAAGSVTLTVTRTGDTAVAASVRYETGDIVATQKGDYTFHTGVVQFAPTETSKTISVPLVNDALAEGAESFAVTLSSPSGNSAVGSPGQIVVTIADDDPGTAPNPVDDPTFFVRQHYLDFLGREPDAPGLAFWVNNITSCGSDAGCRDVARVNVSAAFFLSIEFQETSGFVIRTQRVAFGRQSSDPDSRVPYLQFMRDTRQVGAGVVVGSPAFGPTLEANKQAYALQLVTSAAFLARFPVTPAAEYVDALYASAGVTPAAADRTAAINAFGAGGTAGRVAALRSVADSASVRQAEQNPSFVLAEYFGYLRRNPTDAPDFTDAGYQFWLSKLNQFNGDFVQAEMVKAFLLSSEYRARFGQP